MGYGAPPPHPDTPRTACGAEIPLWVWGRGVDQAAGRAQKPQFLHPIFSSILIYKCSKTRSLGTPAARAEEEQPPPPSPHGMRGPYPTPKHFTNGLRGRDSGFCVSGCLGVGGGGASHRWWEFVRRRNGVELGYRWFSLLFSGFLWFFRGTGKLSWLLAAGVTSLSPRPRSGPRPRSAK